MVLGQDMVMGSSPSSHTGVWLYAANSSLAFSHCMAFENEASKHPLINSSLSLISLIEYVSHM